MESVRVAIQIGGSLIEAEGSETFVNAVLKEWVPIVRATSTSQTKPTVPAVDGKHSIPDGAASETGGLKQYPNVYDEVDGALKVIAHIEGKNTAEKARKLALVLLYGHLLKGQETISSEVIRAVCVEHGCFDGSNFASHIKGLKPKVVMNAKLNSKLYDIKLTMPGRKEAQDLVQSLDKGDA